jgi:ferredoxin-NADP reductase
MQVFLYEITRRLPHIRLAEQRFTYVPNTSFRGPEHLYVEWDSALNPERRDPSVLKPRATVRIGEPSSHAVNRSLMVERVSACADRVVRVRLVSADGRPLPRWTPGSHIDVICGDSGLSRQYSLCGDPMDRRAFEIAVLREPKSRGGSAWVHANVKAGDVLKIRGPRNHFHFAADARSVIFVAGGIGITPISAMAREAKARGIDYTIHYSGQRRASMAMLDELATLHGERLQVHVSEEGSRNDFTSLFAQPGERTHIYACGPARMLEALEASCAHWRQDALRVEHFASTKTAIDPSKEQAFEIELKDSGLVIPVAADQTVLAALQQANIDVQSDCREGLCGSCEVRVLAGKVDHRDMVLTRAEREANSRMMTCCSRSCSGERLVLEL